MKFWALSYSIPANPSRYRVAVWKALKELGAVYLPVSYTHLIGVPSADEQGGHGLPKAIDALFDVAHHEQIGLVPGQRAEKRCV